LAHACATAAIGAFLAIQFAVPTALLFGRRPARFGWQMFSSHSVAPIVVAVRPDGSRAVLRVDDYFAFRRGDIDPRSFDRLPAHICRVEPAVASLFVRRRPGSPWETHACR
jgi:hypothetical protein